MDSGKVTAIANSVIAISILSVISYFAATEAKWFGKYNNKNIFGKYKSKDEAKAGCDNSVYERSKNYFYAEEGDKRIGKIYNKIENKEGILESKKYYRIDVYSDKFRTNLCWHEEETRQFVLYSWKKNFNENKIHSYKKLDEAWGEHYYFKY